MHIRVLYGVGQPETNILELNGLPIGQLGFWVLSPQARSFKRLSKEGSVIGWAWMSNS